MKYSCLLTITILLWEIMIGKSFANPSQSVTCENIPLETQWLDPNNNPRDQGVITEQTISQSEISLPSLWWTKEQFDQQNGRFISNWLAYPEQQRIDLVINRQLWSLLTYLDQYQFVDKLGTVARGYDYNLRVFNQQGKCLALYYFNSEKKRWMIYIESQGRNGIEL